MKTTIAVLLATSLIGVHSAAASPLIAPSKLRLGDLVEQRAVETTPDAIDDPAWPSVTSDDSTIDHMESEALGAVAHDQAIEDDAQAGLAYPLTGSISLGFSYDLEEMEDLSNNHIQSGTVSEDYENHTVLLRAHWRFN